MTRADLVATIPPLMPTSLPPIATRPLEAHDVDLLAGWLQGGVGLRIPPVSAAWRRVLGDPRILCRIALGPSGAPIGFYRLDLAPDQSAELTLVVAPSQRRKGVGMALLQAAFSEARRRDRRRLVAMVAQENRPAREFFLAAGFESTQEQAGGFAHLERILHTGDAVPPLEITP